MKPSLLIAVILTVILTSYAVGFAQSPAAPRQPVAQSTPVQSAPAQSAPAQSAPAQSAPAQSAPAQSSGKQPVQAKSNAEYQAYQTAIANVSNPDAMEKAADDFTSKFPDSDLRVLLYRAAMNSYQSAGNSPKMMDMGLKVLAIDKDDPEALIGVAEVLEERTSPTDLDKEQRTNQAISYAQHALETVDTDLPVPAGIAPDKVDAYKKYLRSTALVIIGTVQYKREQYADAETNLRKAIEADPANPDPVVVLRLALALDQQKKYPEALQQANRAVELTQENTEVGKTARSERDRLVTVTGGNNTPVPAPPASPQPTPAQQNPPSSSTPSH
jgi:tetratricopeptide (TPR) repeat protein